MPPVVARPLACVSWSTSPHRAPPCTRAVRLPGSTHTARITDESSFAWTSRVARVTSGTGCYHGDTEICQEYPGLDEDLYITADAEAFVKWHAGQASWAAAIATAASSSTGPRSSYGPSPPGTLASIPPSVG